MTEAHDENELKMLEIKDFMRGANKIQLLLWTSNFMNVPAHMSSSVRSVLDAFNGLGLMTIFGYPNCIFEQENNPFLGISTDGLAPMFAEKIYTSDLLSVPMDARSRIFTTDVDLVKLYDMDNGLAYLHELILWHPQAIDKLSCFFPPCVCAQIASFLN